LKSNFIATGVRGDGSVGITIFPSGFSGGSFSEVVTGGATTGTSDTGGGVLLDGDK
jgi:hypothetical protein